MIPGIIAAQSRFAAAAGSDPYWANVVSLLHFDGADGSATIVDEAGIVTWTAVGTATISTQDSLFGGGSASGTGSDNQYIRASSNVAFELPGAFTIEWAYKAYGATRCMWSSSSSNYVYNNNIYLGGTTISAPIVQEAWSRLAITRDESNVVRVFRDGVQIASVTISGTIDLKALDLMHYKPNANLEYNGYIDEFRLTKGVARYTSDYTPAAGPFPSS